MFGHACASSSSQTVKEQKRKALKRPAAAASCSKTKKTCKRPAAQVPDLPAPRLAEQQTPLKKGEGPRPRRLAYASDCSGLDGGALAMKSLGVPFEHMWASEVDANYRAILEQTHPECSTVFADVCQRHHAALDFVARRPADQLLVYMAGWPCQPYSSSGSRQGEQDPRCKPLWAILIAIDAARPDFYLLQNVPNFVKDATHRQLALQVLQMLMDLGGGAYYVDWKILDAYTHGGAPWKHLCIACGS